MSQPFIKGETIFKAFWTRLGLRMLQGSVILADDHCFYAQWEGGSESMSQHDTGGWRRTKAEALDHLVSVLGVSLRHAENDTLRLRARIQSTNTLRANLAHLEG